MNGATARPVVGLFGAFDTGDLGEVALRRVLESELRRRRPDIDLVAIAPFGADRPIPSDEGRPARPLPPAAGSDSLDVDALIITGDVLGDNQRWADRYPVAAEAMAERGVAALALTGARGDKSSSATQWFAVGISGGDVDVSGLAGMHVWARDRRTLEVFGGNIAYSGDPLLLAGRVFAPDPLRRRIDLLRMCGAIPAGRRIVIETAPGFAASPLSEHLTEAVAAALRADPKLSAVVATLNPTGKALEAVLRVPGLTAERVHHMPAWAGLDDVVAAMSGSAAVIATTAAGAHIAASLGVPVAAIDIEETHRFASAIPMISTDLTPAIHALLAGGQQVAVDGDIRNLEDALDAVAARFPRARSSAGPAIEGAVVQSALTVLQQRLVDERTALQAELSRVQAELDHLRASPEHRIAEPIREGYRRWQRRRT